MNPGIVIPTFGRARPMPKSGMGGSRFGMGGIPRSGGVNPGMVIPTGGSVRSIPRSGIGGSKFGIGGMPRSGGVNPGIATPMSGKAQLDMKYRNLPPFVQNVLAMHASVANHGRVMETKTPGQTYYETHQHPSDPPWASLSKVDREHYERLATESNEQPTPRTSPTGEPNPGKPPGG